MDKNPFTELSIQLDKIEKLLIKLNKKPIEPSPKNTYMACLDVARMFSVSLTTINHWAKKGILKRHIINGKIRYLLSEVQDAIKEVE